MADATHTSFREAINIANAMPGTQIITFNISGPGPHTIQPTSALPEITDPVVIDATTEPGFAGTPVIEIDGSLAGAGVNGLHLTAGNSVILGLVVNRFQTDAAGVGGNGVLIERNGGNVLDGNYLGTDVTGMSALGNQGSGIEINFADANTIGGITAAERNVIAGNGTGVSILMPNETLCRATSSVPTRRGMRPWRTGLAYCCCPQVRIRSAERGGNVISGNDGVGVTVLDGYAMSSQADMNWITGNLIGAAADGVTPLGNASHGVFLDQGASAYVGTTDPGAGNTIAFNGGDGVSAWFIKYVSIRGNAIFSNAGLGIDLDSDGVHTNFPPNHFALYNVPNYPVLTSAFSGGLDDRRGLDRHAGIHF